MRQQAGWNRSSLDAGPDFRLKDDVVQRCNVKNTNPLNQRQKEERKYARLLARMERIFEEMKVLDEEREAASAIGMPAGEVLQKMQQLRSLSWSLEEQAVELGYQLSAKTTVNHRVPGATWQSTNDDPF